MIRQSKAVASAATLLCLGVTMVVIDSLSTVKLMPRRPNLNKLTGSRQCPALRLKGNRESASRLFAASDFSSHPYSVYYGTSGSTAQQNFGQNDDINDVYGYGPEGGVQEERFDSRKHGQDRNLQSMQAIPLFDGRRGATVFGRKYNGERRRQFYRDPHMTEDPRMVEDHDMMFHDERFMEDQHVMDHMDSLMHERDHLRRRLDEVVSENIHLHNQNNMNGVGQQGQNQIYGANYVSQQETPQGQMQMGQDPSTNSVVNSVMDELKNMQRTVQAFEAQHYQGSAEGVENSSNSPDIPPSVESIKSELKNMEQVLQNLEQDKASTANFVNGQNSSTFGASTTQYTNINGSASSSSQEQHSETRSMNSDNGASMANHAAQLFDGEYEVVIKAELKKKKNGFHETQNPVEKQIDVNKDSTRESPTVGNLI